MPKTLRVRGVRIREARLAAGMTQAQLARSIRTTERNIVRWETSKNQPRMAVVAAIAEATGKSLEFFLGDEDDEEADPAMRLRQVRAELLLMGREDLADELRDLASLRGGVA